MEFEEKNNEDVFVELVKSKSVPEKIEIGKKGLIKEDDLEEEGQLTVDVYQDGDNIVVESTVAGVEPRDLEVNITNDSVTIRGVRKRDKEIREKDFYYQELFWGTFSRTVILPHDVDPEKSEAVFSNGILRVTMPVLKKRKAKKVEVRID